MTVGAGSPSKKAAAPPKATVEQVQAELHNKTVEEIVNAWTKQMESHAEDFTAIAVNVRDLDRDILLMQNKIERLARGVSTLNLTQKEVDAQLHTVFAYQQEQAGQLDELEKAVDEMLLRQETEDSSSGGRTVADVERERTYVMAVDLDRELLAMGKQLAAVVEDLNLSQKKQEVGSSAVSKILSILNVHHRSLEYIDSKADRIADDIGRAQVNVQRLNMHHHHRHVVGPGGGRR